MERVAIRIIHRRLKAVEELVSFLRSLIKPKTGELKTRATFHDQMAEAFSLDEVRQLCFDLAVNFEELPGDTLSAKCRELYLYVEKRGDLVRLIRLCQDARPGENWTPT
jgi:hypothetical protein